MWWIDEAPWPGPPEQLVQVPRPGDLYKHPHTGAIHGIVVQTDVSLHPTASGLGKQTQIRIACTVLIDSEYETKQEFTAYYPADEVDWSPDATQVV